VFATGFLYYTVGFAVFRESSADLNTVALYAAFYLTGGRHPDSPRVSPINWHQYQHAMTRR
jgi:hypothetical protein